MQVKGPGPEAGKVPGGTQPPASSKPADSGKGNVITVEYQHKPGASDFIRQGDGYAAAYGKSLFNRLVTTVAPNKESYVADAKHEKHQLRLAKLSAKQLEIAKTEISNASKDNVTDYSYEAGKYAYVVMVTGGDDYAREQCMCQLTGKEDNSLVPENFNGVDPHALESGDKIRPFYKMDVSDPAVKAPEKQTADWPLKINKAGANLICVSVGPDKEAHEQTDEVIRTIRHLPPGKDGRPDMSKVRFALVGIENAREHLKEQNETTAEQKASQLQESVNAYKTALTRAIEEEFGTGMLKEDNWATLDRDNQPGSTSPESLMAQLDEILPPIVKSPDLPPKQLEQAEADIKAACKPETAEFSYRKDQHKGAIMVIGHDETQGAQLMQRIGPDDLTEQAGVLPDKITTEEGRDLPCYHLTLPKKVAVEKEQVDWPLKVNNAGACVICVTISPGSKWHDQYHSTLNTIRHLPGDKNGLPDMSKVRFVFTFADLANDRIDSTPQGTKTDKKNMYAKYVNRFKLLIEKDLKKNFGKKAIYDIPAEHIMAVSYDKFSDAIAADNFNDGAHLTPPDEIKARLAAMTTSEPEVQPPAQPEKQSEPTTPDENPQE